LFGLVLATGAAFGGFLAVAMEGHDRRIKTLTQLNEISGLPALAAIPQVGTRERARRAKPNRGELQRYDPTRKTLLPPSLQPPLMRYAFDDPASTFADGIRAVRLAIQRASSGAVSPAESCATRTASAASVSASTNPAAAGRPSSVSTDVARSASSGGNAAKRRLIPKPSTTNCTPSGPVEASARIPASFRRRTGMPASTTTSLGHLIVTGSPLAAHSYDYVYGSLKGDLHLATLNAQLIQLAAGSVRLADETLRLHLQAAERGFGLRLLVAAGSGPLH